ncbi:hypothetical protein [Pseudoalteromonas sp.]|uniref:hypothetical protein n=1 Tax=Pseudoalteromonas sp. TaxID=53249 RepID=UPI00356834DB
MNKKLLSLLVLLSAPTLAATTINEQALQACSFIENDFNRLLCYDNTVAGKPLTKPASNKTLTPSDAAVAAPVAAATPAANKKSEFGLEHKTIAKENNSSINSAVATVKEAPYGELIITLENGQQWRQIGSDNIQLAAGDNVIISRGMFNSFLLKKEGLNRSIRVKRTQ